MTVIDSLKEEHENFSRLLFALEHQIEIFKRAGNPDYYMVSNIIDYFGVHPDAVHHPVEDKIFQRLYTHDASMATLLGDLELEHAHLRELLAKIERTLRDVLSDLEMPRSELIDAVTGFVEFFRSHMLMEAGRFFPAAQRVLTQNDWDEIEQNRNHLNAAAGSKYEDMKDQILQIDRELA